MICCYLYHSYIIGIPSSIYKTSCRSEERREGKSVDLGGRRIIKKKNNNKQKYEKNKK